MPTTQTRLPLRSKPWAHLAEWKTLPRKSPSPGNSGMEGSLNEPVAHTKHLGAVLVSSVAGAHVPTPGPQSSQRASLTALADAEMTAHVESVDAVAHVVPDFTLGAGTARVHRG